MKTILSFLSVLLLLTFLSSFGFAEDKIYFCCSMIKESVLDGKVTDDPAWRNLLKASDFVVLGISDLASKQTFFRMGYSAKALYIGVECKDPEVKEIKAKLKDMESVWREDSIEVFIFPENAENYHQFVVNAIGSRFSGTGKGGQKIPLANWQAKTYRGKDYWSVEIRIPFKNFALTPKSGEVWTGNIVRNIYTSGDRHTTWAQIMSVGFHEPVYFGKIIFTKPSKVINLMKKQIATNLKLVSEYKAEVSKKIEDYPSLQKDFAFFLKNHEEIEKKLSQLDTIKKAQFLFKDSQNLLKESKKLKSKILVEGFFN